MTPTSWAVAGLVLLTALRLWVAAAVPMVPDEAYYWVWSRALSAGYLDHPPMVALWISAGTGIFGQGPLGVRFLARFRPPQAQCCCGTPWSGCFPAVARV